MSDTTAAYEWNTSVTSTHKQAIFTDWKTVVSDVNEVAAKLQPPMRWNISVT